MRHAHPCPCRVTSALRSAPCLQAALSPSPALALHGPPPSTLHTLACIEHADRLPKVPLAAAFVGGGQQRQAKLSQPLCAQVPNGAQHSQPRQGLLRGRVQPLAEAPGQQRRRGHGLAARGADGLGVGWGGRKEGDVGMCRVHTVQAQVQVRTPCRQAGRQAMYAPAATWLVQRLGWSVRPSEEPVWAPSCRWPAYPSECMSSVPPTPLPAPPPRPALPSHHRPVGKALRLVVVHYQCGNARQQRPCAAAHVGEDQVRGAGGSDAGLHGLLVDVFSLADVNHHHLTWAQGAEGGERGAGGGAGWSCQKGRGRQQDSRYGSWEGGVCVCGGGCQGGLSVCGA